MEVNLEFLRVGDTIVFADGTQGICTVSYNNGGSRFIRWAVPGKDWSETDNHCCQSMMPLNGKRGFTSDGKYGRYYQHPKDIVDIIKPPLHELQDKIQELNRKLSEKNKEQGNG